ncbi:hypothetical protein MNV49_006900 [Pseudohyphozyma bogoriensis]|nr:hypothetical protein MNV49_006900 [Pseudohyphozyma bogoriensis]
MMSSSPILALGSVVFPFLLTDADGHDFRLKINALVVPSLTIPMFFSWDLLFLTTLSYCTLETVSLHLCIALSAAIVLSMVPSPRSKLNNISMLPLTLLYSSFPTLFLLIISSVIWKKEYYSSPSNASPPLDLSFLSGFNLSALDPDLHPYMTIIAQRALRLSRNSLKSGISSVGNVSGWANEAVLRKVGGSGALVGVSVLLGISKKKTGAILLAAWLLHLTILHAIDPLLA